MREKRFVDQNKESWARYEQITNSKEASNPAEISDLFSKITSDLSHARTHYPKRSIRVYLNHLAQRIYVRLYRQRGNRFRRFLKFWTDELPLALYRSRRELNLSLLFFLGAMAIGVLSSVHDPEFASVILGDGYVQMTEENIANGDPMGVYKTSEELDMFLRITINNLLVAFRTFVLGAFFGIGTLVIMLYNGIMVGTFQYFFIERELLRESFLTIWMHGALEISSIVIAGAAGLTLGRGLLFPGTLPRRHAFILGARRAMKIMIGLVPLFILAGFIEGFFTRLTEMPDILRGSFIFMCFAFIGAYFWWLPYLRHRHDPEMDSDEDSLLPEVKIIPKLARLRKTRDLFTTSFILYRLTLVRNVIFAFLISTIHVTAFFLIGGRDALREVGFTKFSLFNLFRLHDYELFPFCFFLNWFFLSSTIIASLYFLRTALGSASPPMNRGILLKAVVLVGLFELMALSGLGVLIFVSLIAIPILLFWFVVAVYENVPIHKAFGQMTRLLSGTRRNIFSTFLYLGFISLVVLFLFDSPFTWFYVEVVQWNIAASDTVKETIAILSLLFINHFGLAMVLPLLLFSQVLEYHSAAEAKRAQILSQRVATIGESRTVYGMEKE